MKKQYEGLRAEAVTTEQQSENRKRIDYDARRVRHGKTKRDHANGNAKRNAENKAQRDAYVQNRNSTAAFPHHTARGNGNSSKRRKYYG